jgi:hypothetical protein
MWYQGQSTVGDSSIGYATSSDEVHWSDHPGNPIIVHGPDTSFTRLIGHPTVLKDQGFPWIPQDTVYKMWFWGSNLDFGGTQAGIGLATSEDGINWSLPDAPLPSLSGPEFRDPDVLKLGDQRGLRYVGYCADPIFQSNQRLGRNPCDSYPFMDHDPARPEIPLVGQGVTIDMNEFTLIIASSLDPFHMFYVKGSGIHHATSRDGVDWTHHGLVLPPDPLDFWKSDNVSGPSVLPVNDELWMYFAGSPTGFNSNIGLATSLMALPMDIDIKPGADPNSVNLRGAGIIPVAILGSDTFDVANVNVTTLAFGPDGASPAHRSGGHFEDVNADGLMDLISHYRTEETGIVPGDAMACVSGVTDDARPFEGCDAIQMVPPREDDIIDPSPAILSATLTLNETETVCDLTDALNVWLGMDILTEPLLLGMRYTELAFNAHVTDPDSDPSVPGEDDVLGVTATYVRTDQDPRFIRDEWSLVLFEDGSANKFSYTQQASVNLDCSTSPTGVTTCQPLDDFILTSNDPVENDGHFSRRVPTFNLTLPAADTPLLVQDCLAVEAAQVPIHAVADLPFTFRIDAVDRAGNITTWPVELPAVAQPTEFVCEGDECLCCFLKNSVISGVCRGKPGLNGICGG